MTQAMNCTRHSDTRADLLRSAHFFAELVDRQMTAIKLNNRATLKKGTNNRKW
jgi:hypothetical protein